MKRIISIIILCILVFSFVGCDIEDLPTDNDNTPTNSILNADNTPDVTPDDNAYFVFGEYEQDGNSNNGAEPIEWIILKEQGGKLLLISRYILDYQAFNDTTLARGTSWGNSTLRKWLNNEFYNSAFSSTEQNEIATTKIQDYNADNSLGNVTSDKVFILNKEEAFSYFISDYDRAATSTDYARTRKSYVTDAYWLINSYSSDLYKCLINSEGKNENNPRVNEKDGVRPVIWINN